MARSPLASAAVQGVAGPPVHHSRRREIEEDARESQPEPQDQPEDAAVGVHVVQVGQDLGREQDAQRGADGAAARIRSRVATVGRDRLATERGVGRAKRDEPGHDQDHAGEVERPRAHQASDQADDRDGGPGTDRQAASAGRTAAGAARAAGSLRPRPGPWDRAGRRRASVRARWSSVTASLRIGGRPRGWSAPTVARLLWPHGSGKMPI